MYVYRKVKKKLRCLKESDNFYKLRKINCWFVLGGKILEWEQKYKIGNDDQF